MSEPALHVDSLYCPDCGYNLFGIDSDRCPECGLVIDRTTLGESRIPWTHRDRIGRNRALFRTAWLASFRPRMVAQDVNGTVSYSDAKRFRHACILIAWLPIMTAIVVAVIEMDLPAPVWQRLAVMCLFGFSIWLYLLAITGIPALFFRPSELSVLRQNRAVALSYYAAGAFVWMLLPVMLMMAGPLIATPSNYWLIRGEAVFVIGFSIGAALFVLHANSSFKILKHTTGCSTARLWTMNGVLATLWIVLFFLIVYGIPAAFLYAAMIVQSLL